MVVQHIIQIIGGLKLFQNTPKICAECLLYNLTQHTLYSNNEHYISIVDKLKDVETIEQIHHIIHLLVEWAEENHVLITIHLGT